MTRVTWATIATENPMGQQVYERQIKLSLQRLADPDWEFRDLPVTSLRSTIGGARRMPIGPYFKAPFPLALAIGAQTYGLRGLTHRFDLRIPPAAGVEVTTVHDLPPFRFPDEGSLPRSTSAGARHSRMIICPSSFAAQEVQELLDVDAARTCVIPYGLSDGYDNPIPASDAELVKLGISGPFVVHAAGATERKNLRGLADAWRVLLARIPEVTLVLCGPPDPRRTELFRDLPRTLMVGRQSPATVAGLMCRAAAVVVPSTYEGFGLPALEGMACASPVVAARAGALPEVCANAALLVEPTYEGLAAGLEKAITDDAEIARLTAAGPVRAANFSWSQAARRHIDVYRGALS